MNRFNIRRDVEPCEGFTLPLDICRKECTQCNEVKSFLAYRKDSRNPLGIASSCKECKGKVDKRYHSNNREECNRKAREYLKDPVKRARNAEQSKQWQIDNKDLINARQRERYRTDPEYAAKMRSDCAEYRKNNPERMKVLWKRASDKAKDKRVESLSQIVNNHRTDSKWIYVMKWNDFIKVGISDDPIDRREDIRKKLCFDSDSLELLYVGTALHARTVDTETVIHHELSDNNVPFTYNCGQVSREWFDCSLDTVLNSVTEHTLNLEQIAS